MTKTCEHNFIGLGTGVHCTRCGLDLSTVEYRKLLAETEKPKRTAGQRRKPQEKRNDEAGENPNAKEADAQ
nr:MAG TPA: 15 kDa core protein [Caudoviricetes sp.]